MLKRFQWFKTNLNTYRRKNKMHKQLNDNLKNSKAGEQDK